MTGTDFYLIYFNFFNLIKIFLHYVVELLRPDKLTRAWP